MDHRKCNSVRKLYGRKFWTSYPSRLYTRDIERLEAIWLWEVMSMHYRILRGWLVRGRRPIDSSQKDLSVCGSTNKPASYYLAIPRSLNPNSWPELSLKIARYIANSKVRNKMSMKRAMIKIQAVYRGMYRNKNNSTTQTTKHLCVNRHS